MLVSQVSAQPLTAPPAAFRLRGKEPGRTGARDVAPARGPVVSEAKPDAVPPQAGAQEFQGDRTAPCPSRKPKPPRRLAGRMRGKVWMADDFDTWPEGFIGAMLDGTIFPDEDKGG